MYAIHLTYKDKTQVLHTDRMKTVQELWENNSHGVQVFEVVKSLADYGWAEYRLLTQDEVIGMLYGKVQVA
jgi:hypothetical protein